MKTNNASLTSAQLAEIAALDAVLAKLDAVRSSAQASRTFGFDQPWPIFVRQMRMLNPQAYGVRVQNRLAAFYGWTVVSSKLDRGDISDAAGDYHEVKVTFITSSNPGANFVQIRPYQDIAGYHLFVIDEDLDVVHLWLSKNDMASELAALGTGCHGTAAAVVGNGTREYSIRFPWTPGAGIAKRWVDRYRQTGPVPA